MRKAPRAVRRRVRQRSARLRDRVLGTRGAVVEKGQLGRVLPDLSVHVPPEQRAGLAGITANYLDARFDLLGSGWLEWRYGATPPGREGHRFDPGPPVDADPDGAWIAGRVSAKNLPEARNIWRLIEAPYVPIDWQLDARSGAAWSAAVHTLDTPIGRRRGADIKLPWELARLQHLPRLALAFGLASSGEPGFRIPSDYQRAYRNQLCDFLALNPPRFGANWSSAMLTGIRLVNMVVAHDLFRAAGAAFDSAFEELLTRSVGEHARHILDYLDWWDLDGRNNHYVANVAGLAFAGAYLPRSPEAEALLAFADRELASEVAFQFNPDGSHFEGSTAYHAFSAEMIAWSALILGAAGVPDRRSSDRFIPREARNRAFGRAKVLSAGQLRERLEAMAGFLRDVTRPDGCILQVGDNDSGRLLRLDTFVERTQLGSIRRSYLNLRELPEDLRPFWNERMLDYSDTGALLRVAAGLAPSTTLVTSAAAQALVEAGGLTVGHRDHLAPKAQKAVSSTSVERAYEGIEGQNGMRTCRQKFASEAPTISGQKPLAHGMGRTVYADFGLVLFRSERLWMAVRCGGGTRADGGHSHSDALSFELHVDGKSYRVDPGAYVYTSLPWRRKQFRSEAAHGIPRLRSQGMFSESETVFQPSASSASELLAIDDTGMVGRRLSEEGVVYRAFRIRESCVELIDLSDDGQPIHVEPLPWWSPGYGRLTAFEAGSAMPLPPAGRTLASVSDRSEDRKHPDRTADEPRGPRLAPGSTRRV